MVVFLNVTQSDDRKMKKLKTYYSSDAHLFMLIYMNGCGPCNETRPEWAKLKNVLKMPNHGKNVVVVAIDKDVLETMIKKGYLPGFKNPTGFPTIVYVHHTKTESYEDSKHLESSEKNRTIDSFVKWIEGTLKNLQRGGYTYKTKKQSMSKKGGKWTRKYKKSINCKRPKGFSQRQYCKYGRNK